MFKEIPGHMRVCTIPLAIVLMIVAGAATGSLLAVLGILVMVLGGFVTNQTVHLHQPAHADPAPTWIERGMQKNPTWYLLGGIMLAATGLALALGQR